jgi:hypothetical protein
VVCRPLANVSRLKDAAGLLLALVAGTFAAPWARAGCADHLFPFVPNARTDAKSACASPCCADEPASNPPPRSWRDPYRYVDYALYATFGSVQRLQRLEAIEMLTAIASGSQMGPGEGWFHAGQSRYDWKWLVDRYGVNDKGGITRKAFTGPAELFDRLDRNRDGVLTEDDFDWSERSPFLREVGTARMVFGRIDRDSNGRISREEWEAFFKKAAKGKEHLTPDDLREALFPPAPPRDQRGRNDGPSPLVLMRGLFTGEIGSMHEGPALSQMAPDFTLKTEDGKQAITLSQLRGKKPVVLIFGSFT